MSCRGEQWENTVIANVIRFMLLLILGLLVGTMFGIWLGFNPLSLSAGAYIEQQQNAIRTLNTLLPLMGAVCVASAIWLAVLAKNQPRTRSLLIAAVACLVVAAVITRFFNQPINAVVIGWNAQSPPPEWSRLRIEWWQWHIVRTAAAIAGFGFALAAVLWPTPFRPRGQNAAHTSAEVLEPRDATQPLQPKTPAARRLS
jgi:uncharacterized membrane protein